MRNQIIMTMIIPQNLFDKVCEGKTEVHIQSDSGGKSIMLPTSQLHAR